MNGVETVHVNHKLKSEILTSNVHRGMTVMIMMTPKKVTQKTRKMTKKNC